MANPHVTRMVEEHEQLADRSDKLIKFVDGNQIFASLGSIDQALMMQQLAAMEQYRVVLARRLERARAADAAAPG